MDKSEFYKKWYTRQEGVELNEYGFPPLKVGDFNITTEEQWDKFLQLEMEPAEYAKLDSDAADLLGVPFVASHVLVRQYPPESDQLDGIYKALLAIKEAGINIGAAGTEYLNSITAVKTAVPKTHAIPDAPDPTRGIVTEDLPTEPLPIIPPENPE
jgi:hypothetical protein